MSSPEIECDKCGSHKIVEKLAYPPKPPKDRVIKMSEYIKYPPDRYKGTMEHAVMHYDTKRLVCENCGYESEEFTA